MSSQPLRTDLTWETLIGLAAAARRLPPYRAGRPVSPSTVWRWVHAGVALAGGRRVRLEAVRLGGRWLTSVEALGRFAAAQTPPADAATVTSIPRTPGRRQRASTLAEQELIRRGA